MQACHAHPPTFSGSSASRGGGAREVFTAQNLQPLVHVSPMSMMVAVAPCPSSPPPQHSPMLGHLASSHTCERAVHSHRHITSLAHSALAQ